MGELDKILKYKRDELEAIQRRLSLKDVRLKAVDAEPARDFLSPLSPLRERGLGVRVIAEIKKASPSAGLIRPQYDPAGIAQMYEENGAAALSVLTDSHFFKGSLADLSTVRLRTTLPVLRKDFIFSEYQIFEARGAFADAVLLIVRILDDFQLKDYPLLAQELGMAALVEIHDEKELERASQFQARLIGINNRDLDSLRPDLATTERLAPKVLPGSILVSESGISTPTDIKRLEKAGVHSFLVGEALLKEKEPGQALKRLLSPPCPSP